MNMDSAPNPLRERRSPLSVPVSVLARGAELPAQHLLSGNVSMGGMFIRSSAPLEPGSHVMVSFEALGKPMPLAEAEVVWSSSSKRSRSGLGSGFGVRFTRLDPGAKSLLETLLSDPFPPNEPPSEPNVFIDPELGAYRIPSDLGPEPVTVPDGVAALLVAQRKTRRPWGPLLPWALAAAAVALGFLVAFLSRR